MRPSIPLWAILISLASSLSASPDVTPSAPDIRAPDAAVTPQALVTAHLISARAVAIPGEALPIGVALTIAPGWHIYWLHPGDAGIPTEVRWKHGSSLRVDGPRWPAPTRFDQFEGAIQALGYEGQVILPATVTVTGSKASRLELSAAVSWLACHDDCVKGSATVKLELPVGRAKAGAGAKAGASAGADAGAPPDATPDAARIAAFEARVPRPWTDQDPFQIDVGAPATASPGGKVPLTVEVRPKMDGQTVRLEALYVNAAAGLVVGREQRETERKLRVELQVDAGDPPGTGHKLAKGVAQVKVSGGGGDSVRYVQLDFPTVLKRGVK